MKTLFEMPPFLSICLSPLSWLYRAGIVAWVSAYRRGWLTIQTLPVPVISIGNITVGGTGKTPLTISVTKLLKERGYRPAIVSRGYHRKRKERRSGRMGEWSQPVVVSRGYRRTGIGVDVVSGGERILLTPQEAGDEPYLMALKLPRVPVIVGKDRWCAGMVAVERYGCNVIVLDDGFQYIRLRRDLDIVVIDATAPFGRLLPAGRSREPINHLKRADLIVLTRVDRCGDLEGVRKSIRDVCSSTPIAESFHKPAGFVEPTGREYRLDELKGQPVFVVSGVGRPEAFEETVAATGCRIVEKRRYGDHYWYTHSDLERVADAAIRAGAEAIVTTEKDMVRFPEEVTIPLPLLALEITIDIVEGERYLTALVEQRCSRS